MQRTVRASLRLVGFVCLAALASPPLTFAQEGKITGTVVDEYGISVQRMTVQARPVGVDFDLVLPTSKTDDHGRFVLSIPVGRNTTRWVVYPYDYRNGYYPSPSPFFDYKDGVEYPQVEISTKTPEAQIEVHLVRKAGVLKANVSDAITSRIVRPKFKFAWVSDPDNTIELDFAGTSEAIPYRISLPSNTDLNLIVTAPGYKSWSYPGPLNLGPGQDMTVDVQLEKQAK